MGSSSMMMMPEKQPPHAVLFPFPTQGHLNPFLKLAKLLHRKGFHITFVTTEYTLERLLKSRSSPESNDCLPDFCFETIPDGLPPTEPDAKQDLSALIVSMTKNWLSPFRDLLARLNGKHSSSSNSPLVTCIIADGITSFTLKASEELGIPNVLFWTTSACGFLGYQHCLRLNDEGLTPFKDESYLTDGTLDTIVDWTPNLRTMRLKDIPTFIRTTDPDDYFFNFLIQEMEAASKASALVLSTFDALEHDVLTTLSPMFPPIYTLGPMQHLLSNLVSEESSSSMKSIDCSLWKQDAECIRWLDSKEPNSVIYINFGSMVVMTPSQVIELAWGLADSKHNFLWIMRPDLVMGESAVLPVEFIMETKGRGLMTSWCPQEQVLSHASIGAFLTHSGWNSTLESISSGVPMLCWPSFSDQVTNCRYVCTEWGMGLQIEGGDKREDIEKLVKELMQEEGNGKAMRNKAKEWKIKAEEATCPGGSSYLNLDKLVNEVLLKNY